MKKERRFPSCCDWQPGIRHFRLVLRSPRLEMEALVATYTTATEERYREFH